MSYVLDGSSVNTLDLTFLLRVAGHAIQQAGQTRGYSMQTPTSRLVPADLIDDDPTGILRKDIALQGLTAQQEMFCKLLFTGVTQSDAYRQAYHCENASPQTVQHMASRAAQLPKILARMNQLQARWEQRASLDALIRRDEIARGIAEIAFSPVAKETTRLKALELLGKIAGIDLFKHRDAGANPDSVDQLSIEQIERKLGERLAQLKDITPPSK